MVAWLGSTGSSTVMVNRAVLDLVARSVTGGVDGGLGERSSRWSGQWLRQRRARETDRHGLGTSGGGWDRQGKQRRREGFEHSRAGEMRRRRRAGGRLQAARVVMAGLESKTQEEVMVVWGLGLIGLMDGLCGDVISDFQFWLKGKGHG
ncbi:hypothetical protein M0R45_016172 [Rubus argutus]|uniref:Uncharacterized protein n=1 Tax=Rubus argutus TaxID=59490 RepID=A0AAW1XRP8_RUBAR